MENIVGLDFLPRGSGVVTRRPLELRLVHLDPRNFEIIKVTLKENHMLYLRTIKKTRNTQISIKSETIFRS